MKKYLCSIMMLCFLAEYSFSQTDSTQLYTPPKFPNGSIEFTKYAARYINYPHVDVMQGVTGYVDAVLYISKEGKVKLVRTAGKFPEFNAEVKRVLKLSPDWLPGKKNGVPIDTMINQKVYFSLEKESRDVTENDVSIIEYTLPLTDSDIANMKEDAKKMNLAKTLNEEGSALLKDKKFDEALIKFNTAIEQGGHLNAFLFNRGLAYLNLKQDENARADFLEAYRQGDEDAGKIYNDLFK